MDEDDEQRQAPPSWYQPYLERLAVTLRPRVAAPLHGVASAWRRLPLALRCVLGGIVALALILSATIVPIVVRNPTVKAEVNGALPAQLPVSPVETIEVAVDNTGDATVHQLCVLVAVQGNAVLQGAVFASTDHETALPGRVCGGTLTGGEVVSVQLLFAAPAGSVHFSLVPAEGLTAIGKPLQGTVTFG